MKIQRFLIFMTLTTLVTNSNQAISQHRNINLLPSDNCGVVQVTQRIIPGPKSELFEFPWMALLGYTDDKKNIRFQCTGTLINERYVLTAAHCVPQTRNPALTSVRLGDYNLSTDMDCVTTFADQKDCAETAQDFAIEETIIHPEYITKTRANDIALLRLKIKANFSISVSPICLPITNIYQSHKLVRGELSSWGLLENRNDVLMRATVPIVTSEACQDCYKKFESVSITDRQFCADANRESECGGDSGAPLQIPIFDNDNLRYVQFGIVSFGPQRCIIKDLPTVFTNVSKYTDWILDTIKS